MKSIVFLLLLFSAVLVQAQAPYESLLFLSVAAASGDPCTSCTNETFEGTGTVLTGWRVGDNTSANNITNVDFTDVALTGSQSLWLGNPDSQSSYLAKTIASTANVGWRFSMYVTNASINAATNMQVVTVDDNVGNPMASVVIHATGFRINHGTANATTATQIPAQTKVYVWGRRVAGSGANGTAYVAWSTGKVKPTSGNQYASLSNGSTTANTTDFGFWLKDIAFGSQRCGIVIDDVGIYPGGEPGDFQ